MMTDTTLQNWLIEFGFTNPDLNALGKCGLSPLMRAARLGDKDRVHELIQHGVRLNTRNGDGNNALWFACVGEHLEMIRFLINHGIDMNNQNDNGASCLMYASSTGKDRVVATLLECGADIHLKSLDDFTALDVAASFTSLQLLRNAARTVTA
jgi:ankyrin repeat protein